MSKKKHRQPPPKAAPKPQPPASSAGRSKLLWALAAIAVLAVIVIVVSKSRAGQTGGVAAASPEEAKYIGRLLPAGYQEPKVTQFEAYSSEVPMTDITAKDHGGSISVAVKDVTDKKIVYFEYAASGGKPIPLLAYVKPSGKLFVGISYCPPCQGQRQSIGSDITLTCASCGTKRNLESGVGISGACKLYPIDELPVTVSGDRITVQKSVLDKWTPQPLDRKVG